MDKDGQERQHNGTKGRSEDRKRAEQGTKKDKSKTKNEEGQSSVEKRAKESNKDINGT